MHKEPGERRDFLPSFVARLVRLGAQVVLEQGFGAGLGLGADDYRQPAPAVRFGSHQEAYAQDYVLILRCPAEDDMRLLRRGACLISMVHYPTRPGARGASCDRWGWKRSRSTRSRTTRAAA